MIIHSLHAENVLRLRALSVDTHDASVVTVGGLNGQGKTSALNAIAMALGGETLVPEVPIHKGQDSGRVEVAIGDLIVARTFRYVRKRCTCDPIDVTTQADPPGATIWRHKDECPTLEPPTVASTLSVRTKDGSAEYKSPQSMLNKLLGSLTFDPLAFSRLDARKQNETLARLVGYDTSEIDLQAKRVYEDRAVVNREVAALTAQLNATPEVSDVPAELPSRESVFTKITEAQAAAAVVSQAEQLIGSKSAALDVAKQRLADRERRVEEIERMLTEARSKVTEAETDVASKQAELDAARVQRQSLPAAPSMDALNAELQTVDAAIARYTQAQSRARLAAQLEQAQRMAAGHTATLADLQAHKQAALAALSFPVEGLSLGESGVLFNGLPFEQASAADQLRVSVGIGLALNPTIKVMLIRDGSLLDSTSLAAIREQVESAGAQVWIERVAESAEGMTVFIEDGVSLPSAQGELPLA